MAVSAPKSSSVAVRDQALYNDMRAKTSRQDSIERIRTLMMIAERNKPKFESITRITDCVVSLSILANACDDARRLDVAKSSPGKGEPNKINTNAATGTFGEPGGLRKSAHIGANAEKRKRQASPSETTLHKALVPSFSTHSTAPRKRQRLNKIDATTTMKGDARQVVPQARERDE